MYYILLMHNSGYTNRLALILLSHFVAICGYVNSNTTLTHAQHKPNINSGGEILALIKPVATLSVTSLGPESHSRALYSQHTLLLVKPEKQLL